MNISTLAIENQIIDVNRRLAVKILEEVNDDDVREICLTNGFYKDPTTHLINEMIKRNVGRARVDDGARSFVMMKIPGFIEKMKSPIYLRSFAVRYFGDDHELERIMTVFDKSIQEPEFKKQLDQAVSLFEKKEYFKAEKELRIALTIYPQSKNLKSYSYPKGADRN